jgi:hypothetical protein
VQLNHFINDQHSERPQKQLISILRPDRGFDVRGNQNKTEANFHLRYRFSRTARMSSFCSSCCVRLASAVVEDTNPDRPTTAFFGANSLTAKGFHACRVEAV